MYQLTELLPLVVVLVPFVVGHGHILSPTQRMPGNVFKAVCGQQLYSQQTSDINGNVQGEMQVAAGQSDYDPSKCNLKLCKGFLYDDNTANVQSYFAGQTVDFSIQIAAPHTGVMNVSVVDAVTNSVIGGPLIEESDYASNAHTIPANNTAFSVDLPDVTSHCGIAGACVLQWWWDATSINQTYEGCVDFIMSSSGGSSAGVSPSIAPSSAIASSSTAMTVASSAPVPVESGFTTFATLLSSTTAATVAQAATTASRVPKCSKKKRSV